MSFAERLTENAGVRVENARPPSLFDGFCDAVVLCFPPNKTTLEQARMRKSCWRWVLCTGKHDP